MRSMLALGHGKVRGRTSIGSFPAYRPLRRQTPPGREMQSCARGFKRAQRRDAPAGLLTGTKVSPTSPSGSPPTGNKAMVCPLKGAYPTTGLNAWSTRQHQGASVLGLASLSFGRRSGLAKAGLRHSRAAGSAGRASRLFQLLQMAPFLPPRPAPVSPYGIIPGDPGGSSSGSRALPQWVLHGQQNAHRCRSPGRNPGGGASR